MHRVVVLAFPGISPFHLAVPCMLFGERFGDALPARYELSVAVEGEPRPIPTSAGFDIVVHEGLEATEHADTVVVPSADPRQPASPALLERLVAAHDRGARIAGLCLGAFTLAEAGLLDGRSAVTHWQFADSFARRFPAVQVRPERLWADHDDVITSAGVAASLDCCLHLVGKDHGVAVATELAAAIVMAPNRGGEQEQQHTTQLRIGDGNDPVEEAMVWARARLHEPIGIDEMRAEAAMSRRTFTRRFRERTGRSCQEWLTEQRLDYACRLLETTEQTVDRIARDAGFGTAAALRTQLRKHRGETPAQHRSAYRS